MKSIIFETSKGKAIYYAFDNKIKLLNSNFTKEFDVFFLPSKSCSFKKINKFIIELTQQCSMRCSYCCYSGAYEGMRIHNSLKMSRETIKSVLKFIYENYDRSSEVVTIVFYGGEALLCFDEIKTIIYKLRKILGESIHFSISTNGLLLTPNVIDWICGIPNLSIVVSIDGDRDMHDKNRRTISGEGTYDKVVKNLMYLKNKDVNEFLNRVTILSTVKDLTEIMYLNDTWKYSALGEILPKVATINPNFAECDVNLLDLRDADFFYEKAFSQLVNGEDSIMVACLRTLIQPIKERDYGHLSRYQYVNTCLNEISTCFINAEGSLYACEKLCSNQQIGNVNDGFSLQEIEKRNLDYINRMNKRCSVCWAMRLCQKCFINLNYKEEEMEQLCEKERGRVLLALKYYCRVRDWEKRNVEC